MTEKKESFRIAFDGGPWERPPHSMRRVLTLLVNAAMEAGWTFEIWTRRDVQPEFAGFQSLVMRGPEAWRSSTADVLWCPGFVDKSTRIPIVSTIHDINPLLPDGRLPLFRLWRHMRFRHAVRASMRKSWRIATDTDFSRRSLEQAFPVLANQVAVVPLYVAPQLTRCTDEVRNRTLQALKIEPGYILFVGSLRRHKNWDGLIRAYAAMPSATRGAHQLVLAGSARRSHRQAQELARALGVEGQVKVPGMVTDTDIPALYSGAALFAFPSFMEGFGLPPLEAMACGVPVVATDRTSVPEVLGDAALYVDPGDIAGMASAMGKALEDASLASDLSRRGVARAAAYSPSRTAAAMLPLLREAKTAGKKGIGT